MIDTHAHLNFSVFDKDRKELLEDMEEKGMQTLLIGTDLKTSKEILTLTEDNLFLKAVIGVHPIPSDKDSELMFPEEGFRKLLEDNKNIVGIGEIGLDYYWLSELSEEEQERKKSIQKKVFKKQFLLAQEFNLPIVIHCRNAHEDVLKCLEEWVGELDGDRRVHSTIEGLSLRLQATMGVIHSFTGNKKQARRYLDLGFLLGANGIITYSQSYDKALREGGLENILLETDCPYLTPLPLEKTDRNDPRNVIHIARRLAEVFEVSIEEVLRITDENAKKTFKI